MIEKSFMPADNTEELTLGLPILFIHRSAFRTSPGRFGECFDSLHQGLAGDKGSDLIKIKPVKQKGAAHFSPRLKPGVFCAKD